jgi:hypothetical protein
MRHDRSELKPPAAGWRCWIIRVRRSGPATRHERRRPFLMKDRPGRSARFAAQIFVMALTEEYRQQCCADNIFRAPDRAKKGRQTHRRKSIEELPIPCLLTRWEAASA